MNNDIIEKSCCRTECGETTGSAFFINKTLLLTARHNILDNLKGEDIGGKVYSTQQIKLTCIADCESTDLALLKTADSYESQDFLSLQESILIDGMTWTSYGFPNTTDGELVGEPLEGTILRVIQNSEQTIHDCSLKVDGFSASNKYRGFSGSPLVSGNGNVISVIRYKNENYLSGVSIQKAKSFLTKNNVIVSKDELESFQEYSADLFTAFESPLKEACLEISKQITDNNSPNGILAILWKHIFFPETAGSLHSIISDLKLHPAKNTVIWQGWLKLLTYLFILRNGHSDINNLSITLSNVDVSKLLDENSNPLKISIAIKLNFYFTDEDQFFSISRKYIYYRLMNKHLSENTCSIFNSINPEFGIKRLGLEQKQKMVFDISQPNHSGPEIISKVDFGILSLTDINKEVASSDTVAIASSNLENLFKNAFN